MAYKEVYQCDRSGCTNSTGAIEPAPGLVNPIKYPYKDDWWICQYTTPPGCQEPERHDFCSIECLSVYCQEQLKNKAGG